MILVTHAVAGTALVHTAVNVAGAFAVGMASHYVLDMIPHWHYDLPKIKRVALRVPGSVTVRMTREVLYEARWIALDLAVGVILSFFLFNGSWPVVLAGIAGAVLPDILAGAAKFLPYKFLIAHDRFHRWIHTDIRLDDKPALGIASQTALILLCVLLFG